MAEVTAQGKMAAPSTAIRRRRSFAQSDMVRYRRSFDLFDLEKEGRVRGDKLGDVVHQLGYRLTDDQLKALLKNNGLDEKSTVSFDQFLDIIPLNKSVISEEDHKMADLREKFQRYDLDHNGVISLQEAQWALQVELKVCPQTALRLLNQFVRLDYNQFVDFYKQVHDKKMEIYDKFGRYDTDKDGMISGDEAHNVLHKELGFTEIRSKAMVERFDRNKDGLVSYMEFAEFFIAVEEKKTRIRQAFRHFDKEAQGFVTYDQAAEILKELLGFGEAKCRTVTETYDKNHDGKIDYEEFLEFYSMLEEERQRLLLEFQSYDTNSDGLISFEEFETMLKTQGYTTSEVKSLMTGYDVNKDGFLDFEEFKTFLSFK